MYRIDFKRAIADGVVARYDVGLLGVRLTHAERLLYDRADETLKDARMRLITAGFTPEPFGVFLQEVTQAAEGDDDPTIVEQARRYLKAFSDRIDVMSGAVGKVEAVRGLTPRIAASAGTLVFTRRIGVADEIASVLAEGGVKAAAVHSDLPRGVRKDRLSELRFGRLKALVAPTVLDEGIDVPEVDLAVVLGGSRSRRQMIQRMGRVLRLKGDGRKATFVVVYARGTVEDLTRGDGREECLDLIIASADAVYDLSSGAVLPDSQSLEQRSNGPGADAPSDEPIPDQPTFCVPKAQAVPSVDTQRPARAADGPQQWLLSVDVSALRVSDAAVQDYVRAHGGEPSDADAPLRRLCADLMEVGTKRAPQRAPHLAVLSCQGIELLLSTDRILRYRSRRSDAATWDDLVAVLDDHVMEQPDGEADLAPRPAQTSPPPYPAPPSEWQDRRDLIDAIERLAALRERGLLTDLEFADAKRLLLRRTS